MEPDIKKLKQKHKSFVDYINTELLVGTLSEIAKAFQLQILLYEMKSSIIKNKREKEKIVKAMILDFLDYEGAASYQQWMDQLEAPRWYLEKTYPTFYKHFEKKFNQFIKDWASVTEDNKIHTDFKKDLFIFFCRMITAEIEDEDNIKSSIEYVEKNGFPKVKHNKLNPTTVTFDQTINLLFKLPELILASLDKERVKWDIEQKQFFANQKERTKFVGNPLSKRKRGNLIRYEKVAKLMKVFQGEFPSIGGIQKMACEIAGCNPTSFSRWKNGKKKDQSSKSNNDIFFDWQKNIDGNESIKLEKEIQEFIKN